MHDSNVQQLPPGWRSLWRAHTSLPASVASDELTIFVRAVGRDAAHLAIQQALHAMFELSASDLDDAYYNLTSARELVEQGVSERHCDRLFETAWQGQAVEAWVRMPVFVVPDAAALFAAWMSAQLEHTSQYATLAGLPGMEATTADTPSRMAAPDAKQASIIEPLRFHDGFVIPGRYLRLYIAVDPDGDGISVSAALTEAATGLDRGVSLTSSDTATYDSDLIILDGDKLKCAARAAPEVHYLEPGFTDFQQGFWVTLEPGQAGAVRQALADVRRVLAGYRAVVDHLQPWLSSLQLPAWYVVKPVFRLVVARVLDGADQAAALTAFDEAAHADGTIDGAVYRLPADVRQRIADPALWVALNRAAGLAQA